MKNTNMDLEVQVYPVDAKNNLLAFAKITINDCLVINGVKIVNSERGLYVIMPNSKRKNGKYSDVCYCTTPDFREQIKEAVLTKYSQISEGIQG